MDFVRSYFGTNETLPVEHFFPHFLAGLLCLRVSRQNINGQPAGVQSDSDQLPCFTGHFIQAYILGSSSGPNLLC